MYGFVTWLFLLFRTSSTYLVGMLITVLRKRETGLSDWIYNGITDLNNVNSPLMFQNGGKTVFLFVYVALVALIASADFKTIFSCYYGTSD